MSIFCGDFQVFPILAILANISGSLTLLQNQSSDAKSQDRYLKVYISTLMPCNLSIIRHLLLDLQSSQSSILGKNGPKNLTRGFSA